MDLFGLLFDEIFRKKQPSGDNDSSGRDTHGGTQVGDRAGRDLYKTINAPSSLHEKTDKLQRRERAEPTNPHVYLDDYRIIAEINHENNGKRAVVRIDRLTIKAMENVRTYTFFVYTTSTVKPKLTLPEGANGDRVTMLMVKAHQDMEEWRFEFPLLKPNHSLELVRRWDIEDLTSVPRVEVGLDECAGCDFAKMSLIFPRGHLEDIKGKVSTVSPKQYLNGRDGEPIPDYPFPSFSYDKSIVMWKFAEKLADGANVNRTHSLEWMWGNHPCEECVIH